MAKISYEPDATSSMSNVPSAPLSAGGCAGGASAAGLAAREVFRRRALSGPEAHHAHAGSAHRVRERALPEHGRVLGAWHGHLHDPRGYLHARLRFLRGAVGQAGWPAG